MRVHMHMFNDTKHSLIHLKPNNYFINHLRSYMYLGTFHSHLLSILPSALHCLCVPNFIVQVMAQYFQQMLCILFTLIMAGGTRNNTSALFCYTSSLPRILHCWRSRIKRFIESKIFVSLIRFFFFILFYYLECRIKIFLMISDVRSAIAPSICDCM